MDRTEASTVPGGHVLVEALDSIGTRELTEFLVHVVCTGTGVVTQPDTKVLDLQRLLLVDLHHKVPNTTQSASVCVVSPVRLPFERLHGKHTTLTPMISPLAFLTFFNCLWPYQQELRRTIAGKNAPQEIPETGFSNDLIWREDAHAVEPGDGLGLCGQVTANDLVLREGHLDCSSVPLTSTTTRNTDVGSNYLEGGRVLTDGMS